MRSCTLIFDTNSTLRIPSHFTCVDVFIFLVQSLSLTIRTNTIIRVMETCLRTHSPFSFSSDVSTIGKFRNSRENDSHRLPQVRLIVVL